MSAQTAHDRVAQAEEPLRGGMARALMAAARLQPQRTLLRDAGDRVAWCGRPAITWTYEAAAEIVGRLALGLQAWRLPAESRIGLSFAGGAEANLAHLAVEAAGFIPCPLSPLWDDQSVSTAIESAGLVAVLTEGRRGTRRPAEELAFAAVRHFGLRFLAAFGPGLPDGVISLDAMALERGVADPAPGCGLVTFAGGDPSRPVYRSAEAFGAAVAAHRHRLPGAERVLTLLPAHDLRGLVTGLGTALASGAGLETLIPFESAAFRIALTRPVPTRLVVPASFEPALSEITLPWTVRAIDLVHRAPASLPEPSARGVAGPPCLDVLVLDEDAILTRPRGRWDIPEWGERLDPRAAEGGPVAAVRAHDGRLLLGGLASGTTSVHRGKNYPDTAATWQESAYRAVTERGVFTVFRAD